MITFYNIDFKWRMILDVVNNSGLQRYLAILNLGAIQLWVDVLVTDRDECEWYIWSKSYMSRGNEIKWYTLWMIRVVVNAIYAPAKEVRWSPDFFSGSFSLWFHFRSSLWFISYTSFTQRRFLCNIALIFQKIFGTLLVNTASSENVKNVVNFTA